MNKKNLWIAVLSGAVLSLLLVNLPYVNLVNVLLCVGFWASAIFAVWMYRRLNGSVTLLEGIKIGALSGLIAWAVGFLLSFAGLAGIQGLMNGAEQFLGSSAAPDTTALPTWGAVLFNLFGVLFEVFFGILGGLIGGALFRTDREKKDTKVMAE
jgi:hypothetical protein